MGNLRQKQNNVLKKHILLTLITERKEKIRKTYWSAVDNENKFGAAARTAQKKSAFARVYKNQQKCSVWVYDITKVPTVF